MSKRSNPTDKCYIIVILNWNKYFACIMLLQLFFCVCIAAAVAANIMLYITMAQILCSNSFSMKH